MITTKSYNANDGVWCHLAGAPTGRIEAVGWKRSVSFQQPGSAPLTGIGLWWKGLFYIYVTVPLREGNAELWVNRRSMRKWHTDTFQNPGASSSQIKGKFLTALKPVPQEEIPVTEGRESPKAPDPSSLAKDDKRCSSIITPNDGGVASGLFETVMCTSDPSSSPLVTSQQIDNSSKSCQSQTSQTASQAVFPSSELATNLPTSFLYKVSFTNTDDFQTVIDQALNYKTQGGDINGMFFDLNKEVVYFTKPLNELLKLPSINRVKLLKQVESLMGSCPLRLFGIPCRYLKSFACIERDSDLPLQYLHALKQQTPGMDDLGELISNLKVLLDKCKELTPDMPDRLPVFFSNKINFRINDRPFDEIVNFCNIHVIIARLRLYYHTYQPEENDLRNILSVAPNPLNELLFQVITEESLFLYSQVQEDLCLAISLHPFVGENTVKALFLRSYYRTTEEEDQSMRAICEGAFLNAHGVSASNGGLCSLCNIVLEGGLRKDVFSGPFEFSNCGYNTYSCSGRYGPFYVFPFKDGSFAYLVPEESDKAIILKYLTAGAEQEIVSLQQLKEGQRRIITYEEFRCIDRKSLTSNDNLMKYISQLPMN